MLLINMENAENIGGDQSQLSGVFGEDADNKAVNCRQNPAMPISTAYE